MKCNFSVTFIKSLNQRNFKPCLVTKLLKNSEQFGLPAYAWGIRAPTSNPWGKRLKLARKMHFQRISLTLTECDGFLSYYVQGNSGLRCCHMKPPNILRQLAKWLDYFYHMIVRLCARNPIENHSKSFNISRSGKSRPGLALTQLCCKNLKEKRKIVKKKSCFSLNYVSFWL